MSVARLIASRPTAAERPAVARRGRPPAAEIPTERDRHLLCASLLLLASTPASAVADQLSISRSAVYLYLNRALSYDGPMPDALRAAARARGISAPCTH